MPYQPTSATALNSSVITGVKVSTQLESCDPELVVVLHKKLETHVSSEEVADENA